MLESTSRLVVGIDALNGSACSLALSAGITFVVAHLLYAFS
jgi:hypothetical protein